jgi:hypothetical protein
MLPSLRVTGWRRNYPHRGGLKGERVVVVYVCLLARGNVWWKGDGGQVGQFLYAFESLCLPASFLKDDAQDRLVDALFAASPHWELNSTSIKVSQAPP